MFETYRLQGASGSRKRTYFKDVSVWKFKVFFVGLSFETNLRASMWIFYEAWGKLTVEYGRSQHKVEIFDGFC